MTTAPIGHRAISASAGSGKTFQLAHRYIELMFSGVSPDRIIALTFSRKAAGEIFDSVVRYLCRAALSPEAALQTGRLINRPETGTLDFLRLLRQLLESLHRIHIGTLDSFTVGVARAFPLELGIPPGFHLLGEEGAAGGVRQEVLSRVLRQCRQDAVSQAAFEQACQQATFGREAKRLQELLEETVRQKRGYYQVLPSEGAWGREEIVWAGSQPWWRENGLGGVEAAGDSLLDLLQRDGLQEGALGRWRSFVDAARRFGPQSTWSPQLKYLFDKLASGIEAVLAGEVSLTVERRRQILTRPECQSARALMAHIVATEITVALERTRGIYRILDLYERSYDATMRQHGRLTFTDIQYLLTAGNRDSGGAVLTSLPPAGGSAPSHRPTTEARLYVDYRLDCRMDHWLLDEFQDTSDLQWEVLGNLADEILQDSGGQRSFFYVGDSKQAIYGWRGGNARLFSQVLHRYGESIELSHLNTSFRSCQTVIDAVNKAFEDLPPHLPEGAVALWRESWQRHQCEAGAVPANGYAALIEPGADGDKEEAKPGNVDRHRVVARLLQEIDPLRKGLSAAVLVRSNKSGDEIADYLRGECGGMRIIHEGRAFITDNPVVAVLRSLVRFAAHPGDTMAWRHLQMSPLRQLFTSRGLDRHHLPLALLRELQSDGFQTLIREWGARLHAAHPLDDFGRGRLMELTNAAIEFDRTGDRDCDAFLRFIDAYQTHDLAASEAVRVMTIHQAKGLEFDIVILPDLQGGNMTSADRPDFMVARSARTGLPAWALQLPRRAVAGTDDVLKEQLTMADEAAAFDALCLLYVAMTRAKQGLYMVTSFQGKNAEAFTPAAFLKQQFTGDPGGINGSPMQLAGERVFCLYQAGDRQWHSAHPGGREAAASTAGPPVPPAPDRPPDDFSRRPSLRQRLVHVQPSRKPESAQSAGRLFEPGARDARDVGTAVHQLFEKVTWIDQVDIESLIAEWVLSSPLTDDLKQQAAAVFRRAAAAPQVRSALARPRGDVDLWRERRFEVVAGDRWISGAFDRVVISRNQDGRPLGATIIDFKSDEADSEAALDETSRHYQPQMESYRSALSKMLNLPPARVELKLVFTRAGQTRTVGRR